MGLRDIRGGVVIIMMGMGVLVYALASDSIGMFVKVPLTIISIALILFGVFIEHPTFAFLQSQDMQEDSLGSFEQK